MSQSHKLLKLIAVLLLIFAALNIMLGILLCFGVGTLGSRALTLLTAVAMLASGVVWLGVSIYAMRTIGNERNAETFLKVSIAGFILALVQVVLAIVSGGSTLFQNVLAAAALAGCTFYAYCIRAQKEL